MRWLNEDKDELVPKCYNLSDPTQKQMFVEEYRISTLILILQVSSYSFSINHCRIS